MSPRYCYTTLILFAAAVLPAAAAVRHGAVSLHTYVDFATNSGRYASGRVGELLQYLRRRDGGIRIPYTTGRKDYTLPHGVPDFSSVSDSGNTTAVACNYVATVAHNSAQLFPTFGRNDYGVGGTRCQQYLTIEEPGLSKRYVNHIFSGTNDYKLSRLCKIATDTTPAPMAVGRDYKGQLIYRVGGGLQQLRDAEGKNTDESIQDVYLVGGIAGIVHWQSGNGDLRIHNGTVIGTTGWAPEDVGEGTPLPYGSTQGDSGSPYFVWEDGEFKFLMTHHGSTDGNRRTIGCEATDWARSIMERDNVNVDLSRVQGTLQLTTPPAEKDKCAWSDTINGICVSNTPVRTYLRDARGNMYAPNGDVLAVNGVPAEQHTWKSLTPLRNTDHWYAYGTDFLNASNSIVMVNKEPTAVKGITYSLLFHTQNLVLKATESGKHYHAELADPLDLGAGYLRLATEKCENVVCTLSSPRGFLPDTAGYVVDAGATLRLDLCNSAGDYMREWRKVGPGTLSLCGKGKNEVLLNVGGGGLTLLEQRDGYAAWNVLVNTGATVRIKDTEQIGRDFTFGNGGGTLDLAGNSMDWYTGGGEKRAGFSIRALTEQACISNSTGHATLTYREGGAQHYPGAFLDTPEASLSIIYAAGGQWKLSGCHTALRHPKSGLTVQNGSVTLTGTLTVHGYGTTHTRDTADFSTRPNDWHYADAQMPVRVKAGGSFCLGSHARLRGDVSVESGGSYTMHEGVAHESEHIEGGERPESTSAISDFYGHKGKTLLSKGSSMHLVTAPETDVTSTYSGGISGGGDLYVECASAKAAWRIDEDVRGLNSICVKSGRLILCGWVSAGDINIPKGASLVLDLSKQCTPAAAKLPTSKAKKNLRLHEWSKLSAKRVPTGTSIRSLQVMGVEAKLSGEGTLELDLSRLALPAGMLRLQFGKGVQLPKPGSMDIQVLTKQGTCPVYYNSAEPNALYLPLTGATK